LDLPHRFTIIKYGGIKLYRIKNAAAISRTSEINRARVKALLTCAIICRRCKKPLRQKLYFIVEQSACRK